MANPYLSNSPQFGRSQPQYTMPYPPQQRQGHQPGGAVSAPQGYEPQFQQVEQSYYGPDAGPEHTGRMTYEDVIVRTAGLLALVVAAAAVTWFLVPDELKPIAMFGGLIVGIVLGLINAFKKEPSPPLIVGYAIAQGFLLGAFSYWIQVYMNLDGIVMQAVTATFITFAVTLVAFRSGKIRVTPKFMRIVIIATASYAVFCLINLGVILFTDVGGPFGFREGGWGLAIGAFAVILAALNLVLDFDMITRGVKNGVARRYAWSAAFGLTVTLIWLYIEFLRILAILRGR